MHERLATEKGFTLIELLVVISIIGTLASVLLVSLQDVRIAASDAERISDLQQLRRALELYNADFGSFPHTTGTVSSQSSWNTVLGVLETNGYIDLPVPDSNTGVPFTGGTAYYYAAPTPSPQDYDLIARLITSSHALSCGERTTPYTFHVIGGFGGSPMCGPSAPAGLDMPFIYSAHND